MANTVLKEEKDILQTIIEDKKRGLSDVEIGKKYNITYRQLEKIITKATGISISSFIQHKKIKALEPKDFKEQTTTVWSFKQRGNWATHSGEYRGNWSPYIPRNVILKYSKPGEIVLDYFCGAGTTAVEAKLLGRQCIALDINDRAIELAKRNIDFDINGLFAHVYEPQLLVGDARDLSFLSDNSIDLICAHPPYANIIHYTNHKEGDLSFYEIGEFLQEMAKVAKESYRVLKPGRKCAILIGDMRRHKHVVPLGFKLINTYLDAGFKLKELVIKRQHNCKTTGFWYSNSIKYKFLLLAHEYLPIFEKPLTEALHLKEEPADYGSIPSLLKSVSFKEKLKELETTTVWIFPENRMEQLLNKNVIERYRAQDGYRIIDISSGSGKSYNKIKKKKRLLLIKSSILKEKEATQLDITLYISKLQDTLKNELPSIEREGYYVIQTRDIRLGEHIEPLAKYIIDAINFPDFLLKEIVVVTTEDYKKRSWESEYKLNITHEYLLVYERIGDLCLQNELYHVLM
ncbi:MAG: hypothetical protein Fur0020_13250 [Thermodesulfovibrionia bacterium]